jgi:hypothetical protein
MRFKKIICKDEILVCADRVLTDIFTKTIGNNNCFTRNEIEALFSRYALVAMGEPLSRSSLDVNTDDYVLVLILHEIMHHLNYTELNLT